MLCLLIALDPISLAGQQRDSSTFSGSYTLGEFAGAATYNYQLRRRDTVRQGPFTFRGANARALLTGTDRPFTFTGQYVDDGPVGPWTFEFGMYGLGGPVALRDGYYRVAVDGIRHQATGRLLDGEPDSLWTQTIHRVVASDTAEVLLRSAINFTAGVARQSFRLESGATVLLGRVQRDGVAEDAWTVYTDLETAQQWTFDDGQLLHIVNEPETRGDTVAVLPLLSGKTELVDLDARYLDWLSIQLALQGEERALDGNPVIELLTTNAEAYARTFAAIRALGGEAGRPLFRVRLPVDPLTRREVAQLTSIDADLRAVDTISQALLDNTALSVVQNADPEVAYLRAAVIALRDSLLEPVRTLRNTYEREVLPYVSRPAYLGYLWSGGVEDGEILVTYPDAAGRQSRTFAGPGAGRFAIGEEGLPAVEALTKYVLASVDSIRVALGQKSNTRERRQAVTALEEQLTREYYLLDSLLESHIGVLPEQFGLESVQRLVKAEFQRYAATKDVLEKGEAAQQLIRCVEDLDALALQLIRLPGQLEEVRAAYTDEVWNNFTATVMEEVVKKRLYRAYEDRLIPYYLDRVREGLTCDTAGALQSALESLHRRMLALRTAETDALESRLRKVEKPTEILELLTASEPQ